MTAMDPINQAGSDIDEGASFNWTTDAIKIVSFDKIEDEEAKKDLVSKYPLENHWYMATHLELFPFGKSQKGKTSVPVCLKNGEVSTFVAIFPKQAPNGRKYFAPKRELKLFKFLLPMFFSVKTTMNINRNAMDFCDFSPIRSLPDETLLEKLSFFFAGFYLCNIYEKIMLQTIEDEKDLYDRLTYFYQTVAIVGALLASIAVGSYLQGLQNVYVDNNIIYAEFVYGLLMVGSSFTSLTGALCATMYYLTLLGTPVDATDEFVENNLSYLGLPFFCTWAGIFMMMWAMVVSTYPLYNLGLTLFLLVMALPCSAFVFGIYFFFSKNALMCTLDNLLGVQVKAILAAKEGENVKTTVYSGSTGTK